MAISPDDVHGLQYPPDFLTSLPALSAHGHRPSSTPVRRLTAAQFSDIHLKYVTSHAPDHVLFPFLHGLEGDNEAQNQFFASSGTVCLPPNYENPNAGAVPYAPQIPNFRGLVWVAADDTPASSSHARPYDPELYAYMDTLYPDSEADDAYSTSSASTTSDDEDFDEPEVPSVQERPPFVGIGEEPMDLDMEMHMEMDVDDTIHGERGITALRGNEGEHMHPVKGRTKEPTSSPITVSPTPTSPTARTASLTSSSTFSDISNSVDSHHVSHPAPATTAHPPIPLSPPPLPPTPQSYPILTSSFRPRDLVRESTKGLDLNASAHGYQGMGSVERFGGGVGGDSTHGHAAAVSNETGEWEFVEPKVPDGISLRNFGIQAPVYATISDIVVYSPQGNTSASISLAQKFKQAIEKKYSQRLERLRLVHPNASPEEDFGLVKYNVFVLDATPDEIHVHLEHLVTRVEDINIPHSHTDGTDAHAHGDVPDSPPSVYDSDSSPSTPGYDQAEKGIPNVANARKFRKLPANTINFAQREKDEMRDLTRASEIMTFFPSPPTSPSADTQDLEDKEQISGSSTATLWDPTLGQIFLGNASDVPLPMEDPLYSHRNARSSPHSQSRRPTSTIDNCSESCSCLDDEDWDWSGNDPAQGFGYDICIECDDLAPFPSPTQMKKAEEHIRSMEKSWVDRCLRRYASAPSTPPPEGSEEQGEEMVDVVQIPPRPPPNPNAVIHLPFPSSVTYTTSLLPFLSWLESLMRPQQPVEIHIQPPQTAAKEKGKGVVGRRGSVATMGNGSSSGFMPSSLPPPSAFPSPFLPSESPSPSSFQRVRSTSATFSPSSSAPTQSHTLSSSSSSFPSLRQSRTQTPPIVPSQQPLTRPLKVLIYSADGYTESSSLALCLLMAFKNLSLPEAYLELQLEKRRSFFVYVGEVGALKRVEARLEKERNASLGVGAGWITGTANSKAVARRPAHSLSFNSPPTSIQTSFFGSSPQSALKAMNEMQPASAHPLSTSVPKDTTLGAPPSPTANNRLRKRASTMPQMPSFTDHQAWFQDPRFDGSFPSRVLPFLYLGNLNHASNAYMLHALGITHVVSVGECALIPPPQHYSSSHGPNSHEFVHGAGPNGQGSLWIEEREGRIKVLDIKGVCDDGIDTLEPQLGPICEWIDRARAEGGKVLVHCRVGVSRSATVTIAYVMQHLDIPLVDAYLIVRSRRLSVLIQPNMRLLYNLIGWELRLAMEKCREEKDEKRREERLRRELSRCVNWPYLAKEVHALNEKYLR